MATQVNFRHESFDSASAFLLLGLHEQIFRWERIKLTMFFRTLWLEEIKFGVGVLP